MTGVFLDKEEADSEYQENQNQEKYESPAAKGGRGADLFSYNIHE